MYEMTVVTNEKNEMIHTREMAVWKSFIATRKDHYVVPFIGQMLDKLVFQEYYCFLDGYSGYN